MNKYLSLLSVSLISLATWSCQEPSHIASGIIKTDTIALASTDPIEAIKLNAACDVLLIPSATPMVTVQGDESFLTLVEVAHHKNTITITGKSNNFNWDNIGNDLPLVSIYTNQVQTITLAGVGSIKMDSTNTLSVNDLTIINSGVGAVNLGINTNKAILKLSGAGQIALTGNAQNITVEHTGAGSVDCANLLAQNANIKLSGAGNVSINATEKVDAVLTGVGNITLQQQPKSIQQTIKGLGSIKYSNE